MRSRLFATAILLATIMDGCTTAATQPQLPSKTHVEQQPVNDHQPVKPPAVPRNGERVPEQSLPAELAAWKNLTPTIPGGISSVVGDSLFVLASPGRIDSDAYQITISDIKVLDKHVQVEAYLTPWKADNKQGRFYPKDYAKVAYKGSMKDLPVELKIIYADAAFAYVKEGQFDHINRQLLPAQLREWQGGSSTKNQDAKAAVVGDFLYVMVNAGEQLKGNELRFQNVELNGSDLSVQVTYEKANGEADGSPYISPIFARIPFQGVDVPAVKVEYKEYHRPQ